MVVLRFIPTVSFDAVSYAAGLTRMRFWYFGLATFIGQLPGPTIAALVGVHAGGGSTAQKWGLGLLAAVLLAGLLLARRIARAR
jgi:uncharacterized membrane protein YdjX (TVP38/TMEM64 family)